MTVIRAFTNSTQTRYVNRWIALVGALAMFFALAANVSAAGLTVTDENLKLKGGGRAHFDMNFLDGDDDVGPLDDGIEFRRLRYYFSGTLYETVGFKFQMDFADGSAVFKDAYMEMKNTPLGGASLKMGQFKQPFGLEELTSSNYITFIERDQSAGIAPGRQVGMQLSRALGDKQGTIAVSAFRNSDKQGFSEYEANWNLAGRVTYLPMGSDTDEGLLHLGGAFALRDSEDGELSIKGKAPTHFSPTMNGGTLFADSWTQFGGEAAYVKGPFSVQGELMMVNTTAQEAMVGAEDQSFMSYYGMASYFLTGESRAYKTSSGAFNRVSPSENYDGNGGKGALELVARFSVLDLGDDSINQGTNTAMTFGINWYLNKNARVMVNAMRSEGEDTMVGGTEGVVNAIVTRFQVDY